MTTKLAWINLFEVVSARFIAENTPAKNLFGWRIPAQHPIGNRIAWVPGDPSGIVGSYLPPRNPGGYPRSLGTLGESFTILINGQDPSDPENEMRQYEIVRYLRDAWYRAAYHAAYGAFSVRNEQWVNDRIERRHGAALKMVVELQAAILDVPYPEGDLGQGLAPPDTGALVDVQELDVSELIAVSPEDVPDDT
jgi:hypothetical protein